MSIKSSENPLLWFGSIALFLFCLGTIILAFFVPGYSHVKQTVSEIGEMGSPARVPFTLLLCAIGICMFLFATGIRRASLPAGLSQSVIYLIICMGISAAGVGIFAHPHPLHNVFGMSEIIGYQAPLALAITWRKHPNAKTLVMWSWIFYMLVLVAMLINMAPIFSMQLWSYIKPVHGLAQRFLFLSFFGWCTVVCFKLRG